MAKDNSTVGNATPVDVYIEEIDSIREAMLIGLASFGELERLRDAVHIEEDICGRIVAKNLHPIHVTGCSDTVSKFADALRLLDTISWALSRKQEVAHG